MRTVSGKMGGGVLLALVSLGLGTMPAGALMAPEYYERARNSATDVIVLKVGGVTAPSEPFGYCQVKGTVEKVERGTNYAGGTTVDIAVPCRQPGAKTPMGPVIYISLPDLQTYPFGRAYLMPDGRLSLYQYRPLKVFP
ncbi:MAG: hypothetical protein AB1592_17640 [Pseudomonadota bacterium]